MNKPAICLTTRRHVAKSGYTAIKIMINNEVPSTAAETAFLMETMSDVAVMLDDGTEDKVELDLTYDKAVALWHCCNVTLVNDLAHNRNDKGFMMELMDNLAPKLDGEVETIEFPNGSKITLDPTIPEEEKLRGLHIEDDTEDKTECSTEQGRDGGVPNGKQGLSIVGSENPEEL